MKRNTSQRRAIRWALRESGRPLTPGEILDVGRERVASLGIATVYRNLKILEEDGWAVSVQLPGEPLRYEVAGKPHHHHFLCRKCGGAFDVEGCPGDARSLLPDGFVLESHELVLYGLCRECRSKEPGPREGT
ncbi:MAG: transcriptional repressor [Gemmatimonadota bacterium]|jgi:Fur family ferric uptake transcriptional regulator